MCTHEIAAFRDAFQVSLERCTIVSEKALDHCSPQPGCYFEDSRLDLIGGHSASDSTPQMSLGTRQCA